MKLQNLSCILTIMVSLTCVSAAIAQERTAGSPLDLQMTWNSLKSLVDATGVKVDGVDAKVEQIIKCNAKAKLYVPGAAAGLKDTDGCIDNPLVVELTKRVDTTVTQLENVLICSENGKTYNRATKTCSNDAKSKFNHMEVLFSAKARCTQRVTEANQYVGNTNTASYNAITSRVYLGVEGDWMMENVDTDCSPMSNTGAIVIYVPKDSDNKPIKGYFKKVIK